MTLDYIKSLEAQFELAEKKIRISLLRKGVYKLEPSGNKKDKLFVYLKEDSNEIDYIRERAITGPKITSNEMEDILFAFICGER